MQFAAAAAAPPCCAGSIPRAHGGLTHLGAPGLSGGVSVWQGLVIEIVLTFFLVWVVFATAADPGGTFKSIAGLAIGLTITMDVLGRRPDDGRRDESRPCFRAGAAVTPLGRRVGLVRRPVRRRCAGRTRLRLALSAHAYTGLAGRTPRDRRDRAAAPATPPSPSAQDCYNAAVPKPLAVVPELEAELDNLYAARPRTSPVHVTTSRSG